MARDARGGVGGAASGWGLCGVTLATPHKARCSQLPLTHPPPCILPCKRPLTPLEPLLPTLIKHPHSLCRRRVSWGKGGWNACCMLYKALHPCGGVHTACNGHSIRSLNLLHSVLPQYTLPCKHPPQLPSSHSSNTHKQHCSFCGGGGGGGRGVGGGWNGRRMSRAKHFTSVKCIATLDMQ